MSNKLFFYSNDYFDLIFKQKQSISIIVSKYIIKGKMNKFNMIILNAENYTTIYKVFSKSYKRLKRLRFLKPGRVLYENVFFYRKKYLNFKFIGRENKQNNLGQTKLRKIQMYSSNSTLLYLYKKIKGGYLGFSKGFLGFISRKNFYFCVKNIKFPCFSSFYIIKLNLFIRQNLLKFKFKRKRKVRRPRRKRYQKKPVTKTLYYKIEYIFKVKFKKRKFSYFIKK